MGIWATHTMRKKFCHYILKAMRFMPATHCVWFQRRGLSCIQRRSFSSASHSQKSASQITQRNSQCNATKTTSIGWCRKTRHWLLWDIEVSLYPCSKFRKMRNDLRVIMRLTCISVQALLSQMDYASWTLVNSCINVGKNHSWQGLQ